MLYIIGLGLGDEKDITLRGLEAVRKCEKVYIEAYTSLLSFGVAADGLSTLESLYGKKLTVADRQMVEEQADEMLDAARQSDVAFLVVGDPFGATTHSDLVVRAKQMGVEVKVVHNASVMNAIGVCGLQLYRYGETVSIPFFTETWRPDSFYEKIKRNRSLGLHTLCLLDIRVKELTVESLCRGKKEYEPPRFMTVNTAIEQLLEVEQKLQENVYSEETTCVGFARIGSEDQTIVAGSMKQLLTVDFGKPLHCLVIVGETHPVEEEMLAFLTTKDDEGGGSSKWKSMSDTGGYDLNEDAPECEEVHVVSAPTRKKKGKVSNTSSGFIDITSILKQNDELAAKISNIAEAKKIRAEAKKMAVEVRLKELELEREMMISKTNFLNQLTSQDESQLSEEMLRTKYKLIKDLFG